MCCLCSRSAPAIKSRCSAPHLARATPHHRAPVAGRAPLGSAQGLGGSSDLAAVGLKRRTLPPSAEVITVQRAGELGGGYRRPPRRPEPSRRPGRSGGRWSFESTAALLEAAHINRQLLRRLDDPPVTGAERRWWREHFGPPDGSLDQGAPHHMHTNLIDRQWRDRWESLFPEARAARWADWERRGLAARMPYGTYWATRSGRVTVLREMWEAKSK